MRKYFYDKMKKDVLIYFYMNRFYSFLERIKIYKITVLETDSGRWVEYTKAFN